MQFQRFPSIAIRAASIALVLLASAPLAVALDVPWLAGTGSWNTDNNWTGGFTPDATFEEVGVITNGGTATLSAAAKNSAAGLVLGQATGETGTFHVQSGGSIDFVASTGGTSGTASVGIDGLGTLRVDGGGTMNAAFVDLNPGSTVEVGAGAGSATVNVTDGMWLAGRTITHGGGHNFTAANFVVFEGGSQYVVDLTSSSHTKLTSGGQITDVQGSLVVGTSGGYAPTVGTTWDILEGSAILGPGFTIDASTATVAPGTAFRTRTVQNATTQTMQLYYTAVATLTVNTSTGAMSLSSPSGASVDMAGYSIQSPSGQMNSANWNSLASQSTPGWQEAGTPTDNAVSELNPAGTLALNSAPVSLGNVFVAPTEFGVSPDITLQYAVPGEPQSTTGIVQYTGLAGVNNLLLTVDPTTGDAQLKNSSTFGIDVLGYSVSSASGSLDEANWDSLASASEPGWDEANSTDFTITELVPGEAVHLVAGQSFSLGQMFQAGGSHDLSMRFVLSDGGVGEIRDGVVQYGAIVDGTPGDFNNDGSVKGDDFLLWQRNPSIGSLADWESNFGTGGGSTSLAAAVPEPATLWLAACGTLALCVTTRVRRRSSSAS